MAERGEHGRARPRSDRDYFLGMQCLDRPATAIDALLRFRSMYVPTGWAHGRALYLAALAHERLGEIDDARERLDELLTLLHRADPDATAAGRARVARSPRPALTDDPR